ncbi:MAG TPA: SURF1 family protein [Pseudomonadales bacterium]|nr:SURF1 family protein [Pseudomonadales bacterium]
MSGNRFAPSLRLTLFAAVFVPILCALGTWQWLRADAKLDVETRLVTRAALPPVRLDAAAPAAPENLARASVRGRILGDRIVLRDNRTHDGRAGYEVFAVIVPEGTIAKVPEGTIAKVPEGTIVEGPDGTIRTVPDGTSEKEPEGTNTAVPDGTSRTDPDGRLEGTPAVRLGGAAEAPRELSQDGAVENARGGTIEGGADRTRAPAPAVLVNFGWVLAAAERSRLPRPELPTGTVTIVGTLDLERDQGVAFGPISEGDDWPRRVQQIDLGALAAALDLRLYPAVLVADPGMPGVQTFTWRAVRMSSDTHRAYAVQWFGLALVLLVGWIVASLRSRAAPAE